MHRKIFEKMGTGTPIWPLVETALSLEHFSRGGQVAHGFDESIAVSRGGYAERVCGGMQAGEAEASWAR